MVRLSADMASWTEFAPWYLVMKMGVDVMFAWMGTSGGPEKMSMVVKMRMRSKLMAWAMGPSKRRTGMVGWNRRASLMSARRGWNRMGNIFFFFFYRCVWCKMKCVWGEKVEKYKGCTNILVAVKEPRTAKKKMQPVVLGVFLAVMVAWVSATACPVGSFINATNSNTCTVCAAGTASNTVDATSCTACAIGYFAATTNRTTCTICPVGTYQGSTGQTACTVCAAGTASNTPGATSACPSCALGSFVNVTGGTGCFACPAGTYQGSTGATSCFVCAGGRFSTASASSCLICPAGYASGGFGSGGCVGCGAGTYADAPEQAVCGVCPAGAYSTGPASASCTLCPAGSVSTANTSSACVKCGVGYYADSTGLSACKICRVGTYSNAVGSGNCTVCSPGTVSVVYNGSTSCTVCPAGTYGPGGTFECVPAGLGYYVGGPGLSSQTLCPANRFTPILGQRECVRCPPGTTRDPAQQSNPLLVGCLNSSGLPVGLAAYDYYLPDFEDGAVLPSTDTKEAEMITYGTIGGVIGVAVLATVVSVLIYQAYRKQQPAYSSLSSDT